MSRSRFALVSAAAAACLGIARQAQGQFPPEIRGQVIDAVSAASVSSAEVSLGDRTGTRTNTDGSFALRALRPGASELVVRAIGYAPARRVIELANGRVETVVVELTPRAFALAELIAGAEGGQPAPGVTIIDRARIDRAGASDLGEILQQEVGAVVTQRGGPSSPAYISIRGSSEDQVLVLVNGMPLNDPLTGRADLSLVALSGIERIAVLRGAQSARYGPRALGGVIAVETRQAAQGELQATIGVGRWGTRHAAARAALTSDGKTQIGITGGAEWRDFAGGFPIDRPVERGGGTDIRRNSDAGTLALDGAVNIDGSRLGGRLQAEFFDVARGMPGTVVQPSLFARQSQQRAGIGGEGRWRFGQGMATLGFTAQRQEATFADSAPPFSAPYDSRVRAITWLGAATITQRLNTGHLSAGAEGRRLAVTSNTLSEALPGAIEFAGLWATYRTPSLTRRGWQLSASAGARADVATLTRGTAISPQLGVDLRRGRWSGEIRWARAFNPPSLADLFFQEGVRVAANPNLGPERVRNEWNVAVTARDLRVGPLRAELTASAYDADVSGMIVWSPDFRYIWSPANFDVERRGAEITARLAPRGELFAVTGSAAFTDVRHIGPVFSGQVMYRPRWTANASAEAHPFGIDARLGYRYVGPRPTANGSDLNVLEPIRLLDLQLARAMTLGGLRLRLRGIMDNVLDTRAAMLIDYPFPGRLVRAEVALFQPLGD